MKHLIKLYQHYSINLVAQITTNFALAGLWLMCLAQNLADKYTIMACFSGYLLGHSLFVLYRRFSTFAKLNDVVEILLAISEEAEKKEAEQELKKAQKERENAAKSFEQVKKQFEAANKTDIFKGE